MEARRYDRGVRTMTNCKNCGHKHISKSKCNYVAEVIHNLKVHYEGCHCERFIS